jgi:hypothetical protein
MNLLVYKHRLVVGRKFDSQDPKPAVGDILIAMNGQAFSYVNDLQQVVPYMKAAIASSSVELTFLEHESFSRFFATRLERYEAERYVEAQAKMAKAKIELKNDEGVIELLDDD